jgi:hypothetical protein
MSSRSLPILAFRRLQLVGFSGASQQSLALAKSGTVSSPPRVIETETKQVIGRPPRHVCS